MRIWLGLGRGRLFNAQKQKRRSGMLLESVASSRSVGNPMHRAGTAAGVIYPALRDFSPHCTPPCAGTALHLLAVGPTLRPALPRRARDAPCFPKNPCASGISWEQRFGGEPEGVGIAGLPSAVSRSCKGICRRGMVPSDRSEINASSEEGRTPPRRALKLDTCRSNPDDHGLQGTSVDGRGL
jgi:hypothetical protein